MKKRLLTLIAGATFILTACDAPEPPVVSESSDPNYGWVNVKTDDIFGEDEDISLWKACDGPVEVMMDTVRWRVVVRESTICRGYTDPIQGTQSRWVNHDVQGQRFYIRCVNGDMWYSLLGENSKYYQFSASSHDTRCQS